MTRSQHTILFIFLAVALLPADRSGGVAAAAGSGTRVEADPDYAAKLAQSPISTYGWHTDFSRHTVPFSEILSGGVPRDGIPPIDDPKFTTTKAASTWLEEQEPVVAFELNGDVRAYPLQIMTWHEIVNDEVGGIPVAVTFCPLCNSAIVFDRRLEGKVYDFGVSGNLRFSDLIMWDRQTESWWQQFTGDAIIGELAGKKLAFLSASIVAWSDFQVAHPNAKVLSRDTGHMRPYGQNPYVGYDRADDPPFLFMGKLDGRLSPKERVVAVTIGDADVAFPFSVLTKERVVNYTLNRRDVVVFFKPGTRSALGSREIATAEDIGATAVFDPRVDGRNLGFRAEEESFIDEQTGSRWNILGTAIKGPLAGKRLEPIVHANHFWFAWAAFKPTTKIYQGAK
ncbi:MAG: DUF3179 domain-containing protein [Acidiferrobacterales bacterium]|nr:DUF3179 domain-containing protein [Acidiferrobacterales bacterium]